MHFFSLHHVHRAEEVELSKQLRTKAMREAGKVSYKSNYAIIRVKFPDERLLQGINIVYYRAYQLQVVINFAHIVQVYKIVFPLVKL